MTDQSKVQPREILTVVGNIFFSLCTIGLVMVFRIVHIEANPFLKFLLLLGCLVAQLLISSSWDEDFLKTAAWVILVVFIITCGVIFILITRNFSEIVLLSLFVVSFLFSVINFGITMLALFIKAP